MMGALNTSVLSHERDDRSMSALNDYIEWFLPYGNYELVYEAERGSLRLRGTDITGAPRTYRVGIEEE